MIHKIPLIAACAALALAAACKPKDEPAPTSPPDVPAPPSDSLAPPAPAATASPIRFHCDDLDFTAQFDSDHVTLLAPGKEYVLPQVSAASGAKFESDKATFWSKGSEATVQIDGKSYNNCREASATEAPPAP
jgi:membrane-bound inhibitor of C-type lysozyme